MSNIQGLEVDKRQLDFFTETKPAPVLGGSGAGSVNLLGHVAHASGCWFHVSRGRCVTRIMSIENMSNAFSRAK